MQERHLEDMEENWKIWADVAVQMLGHCRWWMMFQTCMLYISNVNVYFKIKKIINVVKLKT